MDKTVVKNLIKAKQEQIVDIQLQERNISFDADSSYVLIGIRRAGKSYQLYQDAQKRMAAGIIGWQDCLFINFEDERLVNIKAEELGEILDCYHELYPDRRPSMYLDEIQNVEGWEKFARRLADEKYRVMITGSNAKMLSNEIATTLGGRYIIREVYPFTFAEYLQWMGIALEENWQYSATIRANIVKAFDTYLHFGGFSEAFPKSDKQEWINSLYLTVLTRDIIVRNAIRNGMAIRLLCRKLAESVMQPTSQTRLLHIVKSAGINVGRNTLAEYLQMLHESYLTFEVGNFVSSLAERSTVCKRYFFDNGLLNNFLFHAEPQLLENVMAIDLVRRYRNTEEDGVYFYSKNVEVDFYLPEQATAIQVSYDINDITTREREVRALAALHKAFPLQRAVIVTLEQEDFIQHDGLSIEVVPAWKWLLNG